MVEDNFNAYYTNVLKGLQEEYEGIRGGVVYTDSPPSFPYMYFYQMDGSTYIQTLSATEDGIYLGIQVEIYSSESENEARKISNLARALMVNMGFSCSYFGPMENIDTSLHRFVGRYSKIET